MKVGTEVTAGRDTPVANMPSDVDAVSPAIAAPSLRECFSGKIGSGKTSTSRAVARWLNDSLHKPWLKFHGAQPRLNPKTALPGSSFSSRATLASPLKVSRAPAPPCRLVHAGLYPVTKCLRPAR